LASSISPSLSLHDALPISNIFNFQTSTFTLNKGPVFCELLLADEINRTPPKTQAALLEAMQERQVTIDGKPHPLGERFMVVATQDRKSTRQNSSHEKISYA